MDSLSIAQVIFSENVIMLRCLSNVLAHQSNLYVWCSLVFPFVQSFV